MTDKLAAAFGFPQGEGMVLSVSPLTGDHRALDRIFQDSDGPGRGASAWRVSRSATLASALRRLEKTEYPVVICEHMLPAGSWKDVLEQIRLLASPPYLIVTSLHADEYLWAEALNLGAYDVLAKPFRRDEVLRVVSLAYLRWKEGRQLTGRTTGRVQAAACCA